MLTTHFTLTTNIHTLSSHHILHTLKSLHFAEFDNFLFFEFLNNLTPTCKDNLSKTFELYAEWNQELS